MLDEDEYEWWMFKIMIMMEDYGDCVDHHDG